MKRIGFLVFLAALAACGGNSSGITAATTHSPAALTPSATAPTTLTVRPVLIITKGSASFPNYKTTATGCKGAGAYAQYHRSSGVTVYDQRGIIVGTGVATTSQVRDGKCLIFATVRHLQVEPYYQVRWINGNKVAFSRADLVSGRAATQVG